MKKYLPILGMIWLTALACFIWGAAMVYYDILLLYDFFIEEARVSV